MRTKEPLGAEEHALLGILFLHPRHAYDLASDLAAESELALVCRVERGLVYSLVRRLEQDGLIQATRDEQPNRPARNVLSLTDTGRAELLRWLSEPAPRIREIRRDFFIKLFFSRRIKDHDTRALVRSQVQSCAEEVRRFRSQLESASTDFARLVLDSKIANAEGSLRWLESHVGQLCLEEAAATT